ncbi:hypothetical protein NHX12_026612 [Muraenolepis orangiensis]|uniref:Uncharacterized protein n=1 Tax=Muraenolepis orangiensis TaxID=630683 RepID=A0A9Q0EKC8_9TELE|nr:hypothetical protein NHX12_026612 [Muraenolepis orangiensis]
MLGAQTWCAYSVSDKTSYDHLTNEGFPSIKQRDPEGEDRGTMLRPSGPRAFCGPDGRMESAALSSVSSLPGEEQRGYQANRSSQYGGALAPRRHRPPALA